MNIKYNIHKLERILNDLSTLTDISINFCDAEGNTLIRCVKKDDYCSAIQKQGNNFQRCRLSDKGILNKCKETLKVEHHICYAGLCDLAMPIIKRDTLVGFIILGRIRTSLTSGCPETDCELTSLYELTPIFTDEKLQSIIDLLPRILFASAIEIEFGSFITQITEYIDSHLQENLSIASICSKFHVSKNYLYEAFHSTFNCTVNEYISMQRLKIAMELLSETEEPVYHIAEMVGIDNYTYFCKLFKKKTGTSPTEYRKAIKE